MALSPQAMTIAVVYVILTFVSTGIAITQDGFGVSVVLGFLFSSLFIALVVYDTLCLTQGDCGVWSWIRTALYLIVPTIALIVSIFLFVNRKEQKSSDGIVVLYDASSMGVREETTT